MNDTNCNGAHTKGDGSYWIRDGRGIMLARVCAGCKEKKLSKYRPEVLNGDNYDADESIYGD